MTAKKQSSRRLSARDKKGQQAPYKASKEHGEKVAMMAAVGVSQEKIAKFLGIDKKTLTRHYAEQLENGAADANLNVASAIYREATGGNITACIWWTKNRMGWRDKPAEDDDSEVPTPVQVTVNVTDASVPRA